ncbi:MAG: DUF853 domain-containing protein [Bacteroidaceae bacterium]|nr:DUF853 domain-containing protein [Bacteroidaceae bacterium]
MYTQDKQFYVAHGENGPIYIQGKMVNRHGLIAGATGTGKTVSLQVLAESFSQAGIPCFMADMKGDLSGISQAGNMTGFIEKRCTEFGIESPQFSGCPVTFYDVYGEKGHPMRTTISNMGPELLARLLSLNETQSGVLNIVFKVADERGLLLIDMKDLRSMLNYVAENAHDISKTYGNVASQSIGAIQRALLALENQGAETFFAEPSFDIMDLLQCSPDGKGMMNVLAADRLMLNPKLYSSFLLWLLSDLYVQLPEVGDLELPRLVFFFDEAHTLFDETPKALVDKIEQVVRLIRSKGVGVYLVTQNPTDIPDSVLAQLGNRIQHALRAFTPKEQKNVRSAANTFRANPAFKTEDAIMELGTGEALVSFLDDKGTPQMVERAKILFPLSQIGAISDQQRDTAIKSSRIYGRYDKIIDRESAFEVLLAQSEKDAQIAAEQQKEITETKEIKEKEKKSNKKGFWGKVFGAVLTSIAALIGTRVANSVTGSKSRQSLGKAAAGRAVSTATRTATRELTRSILGNLIK